MAGNPGAVKPRQLLSLSDGIVLICGMVIGAGIFKAPSIVAANTGSNAEFMLAWVLGGAVSLCGALVYAELASRYPETGGEYAFLSRGMGRGVAFVFAWARMTVIQTGAIAAVAFVFGDYASEMLRLGEKSSAVYAAVAVVALTAINVVGTLESKYLQKAMQYLLFAGLAFIAIAGLVSGAPPKAASGPSTGTFGLAMIFVLLTYGGWNEAAYLGGEVRDARRNMMRILVGGILAVTLLYLVVNLGYLMALGLGGMRESQAVAADVMRVVAGDKGAVALALIVCLASLTTMNAAIFTGARTNYALGRDFPLFRYLGRWDSRAAGPVNALLVQGVISLALVGLGILTGKDFVAMVDYTAPVFWLFLLLTGLSLFVFRRREDAAMRPFSVPLYPITPAIFVLVCGYMLYSSLVYTGVGALVGVAVLAVGVPVLLWSRQVQPSPAE